MANQDPDFINIEQFVRSNIDNSIYLEVYPDVAAAGLDPAGHWLQWGIDQNRMLHPKIVYIRNFASNDNADEDWQVFERNGEQIGFKKFATEIGNTTRWIPNVTQQDMPYIEFISNKFDHHFYIERYPDVTGVGIDPVAHWLEWGFDEGRVFDPLLQFETVFDETYLRKGCLNFNWKGRKIQVRSIYVPDSILSQVKDQYEFEPAIFAPGAEAIAALKMIDAPDLYGRNRVDVNAIFRHFTGIESTILIIPLLVAGGAEKYSADIVRALTSLGENNITVIVTDQSEKELNWTDFKILEPIKNAKVVYWRDICHAKEQIILLARLLNSLRPRRLFVINSRLGLDVVATHGLGLSQNSDIYCAYFSVGPNNIGNPYGSRFPKLTGPYSTTITDNSPMERYMKRIFSSTLRRTFVLPPRREISPGDRFVADLGERIDERQRGLRKHRWLWFSRVEINKGTAILNKIAEAMPVDIFDVYGPGGQHANHCGLVSANICIKGAIASVDDIKMSDYDGFLFTSLFEGMPNAVLEIAQLAIPMIVADVGGLRDTFSDSNVAFVDTSSPNAAEKFVEAMNFVLSISDAELNSMLRGCREDVRISHSPEMFETKFRELLNHD